MLILLRVDFESDDILLNFSYWDVQWRNIELSRATDDALFDDQFGYEIINLDNENSLPYLMTYNEDDEKYVLEFYKEVHKILNQDLEFLKRVNITIFPVLIFSRIWPIF